MPPTGKVDSSDIIKVLLQYKDEICSNYRSSSSDIWVQISDQLDKRISPKALYTIINLNRYRTRELLGIPITEKSNFSDSDEDFSVKITLPVSEWNTIRPIQKYSNGSFKLQQGWCEIFAKKINEGNDNNCLWSFKRCNIGLSGNTYLKTSGICTECAAKVFITAEKEPEPNEGLTATVEVTAVNVLLHTDSKTRQLRGVQRKEIGRSLCEGKVAVNWQREHAYTAMSKKQRVVSRNFYSLNVLRKCKQEYSSKKLADIDNEKSYYDNLIHLKYVQPYCSAIHFIGLDKFMLHYWTPEQLLIYNSYIKNCFESVAFVDATGSLVRKLNRPYGQSGHIFLYSAVIHLNTPGGQVPVTQMLSESHDTLAISYWLGSWKKYGATPPKIVVCDHSLALLGAISWVFLEKISMGICNVVLKF